MAIKAFGKFTAYKKSGAYLYVPERVYRDDKWPFKDGERVKIFIEDGRVVEAKTEWYEEIPWERNRRFKQAYSLLPEEIKVKIQQAKELGFDFS